MPNKLNISELKKNKDSNYICEPPHPKICYTCYLFDEEMIFNQKAKKDGSNVTVNLHTQKALVISSFYEFYVEFTEILKAIKRCMETNLIGFDLEKAVHSLVFDIPSPCPGMIKVSYDYSSLYKIEFELYPINKVPKPSADLKMLFNLMKINEVILIFRYIILEIPVIFFCQDKFTLSNIVKSFEEILFPFKHPYAVIEILPKEYYKSLEKLSCFIVGINQKYSKDFFEVNNINLDDKEYVVVNLSEQFDHEYIPRNIDKYGIILKDCQKKMERNKLPGRYMLNKPNFPKHYLEKLMKNLNNLFIGKNGMQKIISYGYVENDEIRYQFYYFFISMLQHYKSYLNIDKINSIENYSKVENESFNINELFKMNDFIFKDNDSIEFFQFFMDTQIWKSFLMKNIFPSTIEEKLEVLLLDENIRKKRNKNMIKSLFKENTPFLETFKFNIINVETIKIEYDKDQEMHISTNNTDLSNYFPLLNDNKMKVLYEQNFLFNQAKPKNLYQEFYVECQLMLKDKKFLEGYNSISYNLNKNEELESDNENYVLKLWYLLICYNFKHLDKEEKWTMFNEMFNDILNMTPSNKISIIDSFLSDLLFSTFIKYGDKEMCSLLYKELNDIPCVKDDYLIFTHLHEKFMNKKDEFDLDLPKEYYLKEKNYNIYNLPKGNKMEIVLISACPKCKIKFDLRPEILNFSSMKNDEIYFKCNICKQSYIANIAISKGKLYRDEKYKLLTPKYLFYCIKNLGDFNNNNFYEIHKGIFYNLLILFQLKGYNYNFLFPNKEQKSYYGFDPNDLKIEKEEGKSYIQKNKDENKPKWYENIEEDENLLRHRRFTKIMHSRKASAETFKTFEPLSSTAFFQKSIKKTDKNLCTLKYSKTINE